MIKHNLFPQKVFLNEEKHKYFDDYGNEYIGFTKFSELFCKPFNKDLIAGVVAKSEEVSKAEILERWETQRDNGSRIDKCLELTAKTGRVPDEYADVKDLVLDVLKEYDVYHTTYEQVVVYNEYYRIAGSPDKFGVTSNRKDASFEMSDFKVFEKDDMFLARGWFEAPFTHFPKTKYHKIALQLSYYAWQLEELMQKRCRALFIHLINPITNTHQKIPVPYLKNDIIIALEMNKEKILTLVTPEESSIF